MGLFSGFPRLNVDHVFRYCKASIKYIHHGVLNCRLPGVHLQDDEDPDCSRPGFDISPQDDQLPTVITSDVGSRHEVPGESTEKPSRLEEMGDPANKFCLSFMSRSRPRDVSPSRMGDPSGPGTRNASKACDLTASPLLGSSQASASESSRSEHLGLGSRKPALGYRNENSPPTLFLGPHLLGLEHESVRRSPSLTTDGSPSTGQEKALSGHSIPRSRLFSSEVPVVMSRDDTSDFEEDDHEANTLGTKIQMGRWRPVVSTESPSEVGGNSTGQVCGFLKPYHKWHQLEDGFVQNNICLHFAAELTKPKSQLAQLINIYLGGKVINIPNPHNLVAHPSHHVTGVDKFAVAQVQRLVVILPSWHENESRGMSIVRGYQSLTSSVEARAKRV